MSYNRFPDSPGSEHSIDRNVFNYIRIVVLDINLEDVEPEVFNFRKQEFVFLDTSIQNNPVSIKRDSSKRPLTCNQLWEFACRYAGHLFKQYFRHGVSI